MGSVSIIGVWITPQIMFWTVVQGLVFGLLAMGIVLIYRSTRVINFAVGNMGLPGATLFALMMINYGWPFWPALALSLAIGGVVGLVTHRDLLEASLSNLTPLSKEDRQEIQHRVPVASVMRKEVWSVEPHTRLVAAIAIMRDRRIGCLCVVHEGKLVGILTEADVIASAADALSLTHEVPAAPADAPAVRDVMTPAPQVIQASQPVHVVRDLMAERGAGQIIHRLIDEGLVNAVHDLSDGGLAVALAEMADGSFQMAKTEVKVTIGGCGG